MAQPEREIQNTILQWLSLQQGIVVWRQPTIGTYDKNKGKWLSLTGYARKGISDILGVIAPEGRFLVIEVKTPKTKNRVTAAQKSFIDDINRMGGIGFVATSLDDVINELGETLPQIKKQKADDWV